MKNFKVSIPTPCHEDWNKMSPESNGRFCNSCEKTVVDFTSKSQSEIKSYLDNTNDKICGRFKTSDVYIPVVAEKSTNHFKNSWFKSKWLALTALISLNSFSKKANAQGMPVIHREEPDTVIPKEAYKKTSTVIHGWIKSVDAAKGIAQVEIRIYSGGKEIAFTKNFTNGSYFITIPENMIWDFKVDIEYSSLNYQTQIIRDLPIEKDRIKFDINLVQAPQLICYTLGGVGGNYEDGIVIEKPLEITKGKIEIRYDIPELDTMYTLNKDTFTTTERIDEIEIAAPEKTFDVIAYPNPGIGLFNFRIENSEKSELFIFDVEGKLIESRKTTASQEQVDLTNHPNGTYVVRVVNMTQNKVKQLKLIKIN